MTIALAGADPASRRPGLVARLLRRFVAAADRARIRADLARLDHRMLRDIGFSRAEIDEAFRLERGLNLPSPR